MKTSDIPEKLVFNFTMCAVVFGADKSLLKVQLNDGFSFTTKSLIPSIDNLDKLFMVNAKRLRRDYEQARVDTETLDVLCVYNTFDVEMPVNESQDYFEREVDRLLVSLDNQIRAIRLLKECAIRVEEIAFRLDSENYHFGITKLTNSYHVVLTVSESIGTKEISKISINQSECDTLNEELKNMSFPLNDNLLYTCYKYYDLSYHQENYISITLLITSLEILLLRKKDSKKKDLSNRCAVYLYGNESNIMFCRKKLRAMYEKRSSFVHEGRFSGIENNDILFLRNCVRRTLLKALNDNKSKEDRIAMLKSTIESLPYLNE